MEVGLAIAIGASQSLAGVPLVSAYEISASGGTVTVTDETADHVAITISGHAEPSYNGAYNLTKADLASGLPIILLDPVTGGTGGTFTATPGLIVTPADDPPEITRQWFVGTDTVARASGTSYTLPSGDAGQELRYVEIAANVAGSAEVRIIAQEESVAAVQPAVLLSPGTSLRRAWPHASSTYWLFHTNLTFTNLNTSNGTLFDLAVGGDRILLHVDGSITAQRMARSGGNIFNMGIAPAGTLGPNMRLSLLLEIDAGAGNTARGAYKIDDRPWVMALDGAIPGAQTGDIVHDAGVELQMGIGSLGVEVTHHRSALWRNLAAPADISLASTRNKLVAADGRIKPPGDFDTVFGAPTYDIRGHAADWSALTNYGTGGAFTSLTGTVANA